MQQGKFFCLLVSKNHFKFSWDFCADFLRSIYDVVGKVVERETRMSFSGTNWDGSFILIFINVENPAWYR